MKIAVFGATGKTGMQIVEQALAQGHEVKAFVRDPQKMTIRDDKLESVQGDVLEPTSVETAIEGVDAVLVALGAKPDTKATMMTEGTKNIVNATKKHKVKKLIVEGSYPMSGSPESMEFLKGVMSPEQIAQVRPLIDDKAGQERVTKESGLDWVIVRPLMLTDGAKTGNYRIGESLEVKPGNNISRADVADFMLKQLTSDEWLGKTVIVSY